MVRTLAYPTMGEHGNMSVRSIGFCALLVATMLALSALPALAQGPDSTTAATLPEVTVSAKATVATAGPNSRKYDLFLMRRKHGMGTFLTREQIDSKPSTHTYQLFQNIPGLKISQSGTQWIIKSQRCPSLPGSGGRPIDLDRDHPTLPLVFIDGFRVRGLNSLNAIKPNEVEAIEVYQGAAQLPGEAKGDACAAIFVWLRQKR